MTAVETSGFQLTTLRYNGSDNLIRETARSGRVWNYAYDTSGRLSSVARSGAGFSLPNLLYTYDDNGNLTTVRAATTPSGSGIRRTYDQLNRLSSFTDLAGNRLDYFYDRAGNLSALRYPDGRTVSYAYDAANRLAAITDWANRTTRYSWDASGRLTHIAFPNGTTRRMTYDVLGRVTFRQDRDSQGQVIVSYRYAYDASGQVSVESPDAPNPPYIPASLTMTYDNDNRLATFNGQSVTFDLDANMTRGPLDGSLANFGYDFNGNLTQAGNVIYSYDAEDRLTGFAVAGAATTLVNDPGGGVSRVLQKRLPNGTVTNYVWGVGLAYEETAGQIRVYHYDQRGSTVAFTGTSGAVTGRVSYGPFGEIGERSGDTDSLFLYGGLFGVVTGPQNLYYMRFRWYSPEMKRFVNQDGHFGDVAVPGTLNRFAYVGNNPVLRMDPSGECWVCLGALIGATVGVAAKAIGDYVDDGKLNDPWQEYAGAAIGGAVTGAIISACPTCGALAGGAGAAAEYLTAQGFQGKPVDPGVLAVNVALGAAVGRFIGSGGKGLTRPANFRFATNGVGQLVKRQAVHQLKEAGIALAIVYRIGYSSPDDRYRAFMSGVQCVSAFESCVQKGLAGLSDAVSQVGNLFSAPAGGGTNMTSRPLTLVSSRAEVNRGKKGVYGEYIHYQTWLDAMMLAARPVPDNPNNLLTSF
jgi:RHS repeat-associated protein